MTIGLDISVLNDRKKTGIALYTYNIIKALLHTNKKDSFILFGISTLETFDYLNDIDFKKYPNVKLVIKRIPAKFFRTAFLFWQKINLPPIEMLIGKVDVYHSINWYFPPQRAGKKIATVFDLTSILYPYWHHRRTVELDKLRLSRIKNDADLIVTISENSKKDFLKFSPQSSVEVIYPSGNNFNFKFDESKDIKILKKYNLKPGYILSVATIEPRKNLSGLIKAYIQGDFEQALVLVGMQGWKTNNIAGQIKNHNIRILGYIPDEELPVIYKYAKFFIYPSFYEGFGIPVLEALNFGIPVICSKTSSLPEVAGKASLYIDPYDINSITDAMKRLDTNNDLRKQLVNKGIIQSKRFSWEESAIKLNGLYHNL